MTGSARAYPLSKLTVQSPVLLDEIAGKPIMLVLGPDGKSVRVFSREMDNNTLEFYGRVGADAKGPWGLLESTTLSEWGFDGCAISGSMQGRCLGRVNSLKDFWFDWQHYHPESDIYRH